MYSSFDFRATRSRYERPHGCCRMSLESRDGKDAMSSTIENLERELATAQREREDEERAVIRSTNAHEAVCGARDDAWTEDFANDPEIERLTTLVYQRRRELYEAVDRLKAAEGKERRIKSRLMYVLPAERRRYLSGTVDEEFEELLASIRLAYSNELPEVSISVVTERPDEVDLSGDATWRALERLYSGTTRRWVEVRSPRRGRSEESPAAIERLARQVSYYAGGHLPRVFEAGEELKLRLSSGAGGFEALPGYDSERGRFSLARITIRRYLDESSVSRLCKRSSALVQIADIARLYQTMSLTVDEIRWRLEQLISLRLEVLEAVYRLTGERRRFSFYEIARAARLLDTHFPDPGVAAEALASAVERSLETGVPLVDVAYMSITK